MSSIRLTNDMRERTLAAVLSATFDKRQQKLRDDANKLAQRIMRHALGDKLYQLMVELPDGWLSTRADCKVELAGTVMQFDCDSFRVPKNKSRYEVIDIVERRDSLCAPIENHVTALKELCQERNTRTVEINAVLESATTVAKLLEMWPEVERFLPPAAVTQIDRTVPVVQIQALNEALGLRKHKRAA